MVILLFNVSNDAITTTEAMRITSTGNVGIGTTSPGAKLELNTTSNVAAYFFRPAAASGDNTDFYIGRGAALAQSIGFGHHYDATAANTYGYISNYGDGAGTGLVIQKGGNVGIGTTTPGTILHVKGTDATLKMETTTTAGSAIALGGSGTFDGRYWDIISGGSGNLGGMAGKLFIYDETAAQARVTIDTTGNVGIGTTSPGYLLTCNGQPGANGYTAWTNYSDQRLKENIKPVSDGMLDKIMKLVPAEFNYNDKYYALTGYSKDDRPKLYGFIAQELKEVFPEMVESKELKGQEYFDTNLTNLQIYLVKAVQEQQRQIKELKDEIATLKRLK